ncbi:transporter, partial [Tropicimonas sp.]|uniref:transporter n=1 Tax=Tropicimonas sp. TaxID=2067044 RepID=UPI003A856B48
MTTSSATDPHPQFSRRGRLGTALAAAAALLGTAAAMPALAAEGGIGFYILGSRTINAGIVPPPGEYLQFSFYGYSGGKGTTAPLGGRIDLGLSGDAAIGLITGIWALDSQPVLGGRPYLVAVLPVGWKKTTLDGSLSRPGGDEVSGSRSQDKFLIGDPVLGGGLGWGEGPWFASLNLLVNVPVGDYAKTRVTNLSFN